MIFEVIFGFLDLNDHPKQIFDTTSSKEALDWC
jgi:hypothetical protein